MHKPTLYLLVGYPGAGKTTASKLIARHTGAVHIWTDRERHKMFDRPSHTQDESRQLYDHLNKHTSQLLAEGKSVVFDTNFNYRRDRDLLRAVADRQGADTLVIWLVTPAHTARHRAVRPKAVRNGYDSTMSVEDFDRIAGHLEAPAKDEKVIKINGTKLDSKELIRLLST